MKNTYSVLVSIVFALWLTGCTNSPYHAETGTLPGIKNPSVRVLASKSTEAPLSGSFGWGFCLFKVKHIDKIDVNAISERLHNAMRSELAAKGLVFAESEPDILVSYALADKEEINADELNKAYGDLLKMPKENLESGLYYQRGALVIDIVDRKSGWLLWRGAIMAELDMSWPEDRKQERCNSAIKELLRHYPRPEKTLPQK